MPDQQREFWSAIDTEYAMADYGAAQTWVAGASYTLTEVWLRMANSSPAYNGTLTLDLYSVSGGEPNAKIATLWSGSVNSWGTVQSWRALTGISQAITNGVTYAHVVTLSPSRDATHYIRWSGKTGYAGGVGYQEDPDGTYTDATIDWHFVNYGAVSLPTKADTPSPANNATGVDFSAFGLSWNDGGGADTYDVWIGPSGNLVKVSSAQAGTTYTSQLSECATGAKTYWRIDSTNGSGTTTGDTWNFDPRPVAAKTPSPVNTASDITLDETPLGWADGGNSDTYEIYYRAQGDGWTLVGISQAGITWTIPFGAIDYGVTYEWAIDATNQFGVTTGSTWSFDAIAYDQIQVSFRLISGGNGNGPYASTPGVQGTDWEYTGINFITAVRKLVAAANNKIWYEDI